MGCSHVNADDRIETRECLAIGWFATAGGRDPIEVECHWEGEVDVFYCSCDPHGSWTCPKCDTEHGENR